MAGLIFSEEESISGWINRTENIVKMKMPNNFDEIEKYNEGHTLECFHNLDVDVINAEIKALHHSALLFFEKQKLKKLFLHGLISLLYKKILQL